MARSIADIKKEITDAFMADDVVRSRYGFAAGSSFSDVFSSVSIENLIFYIHAVRTWALETLFDEHLSEVNDIASRKRAHTLQWYREKAIAFQYGQELNGVTTEYDNSGLTEAEVERSMIVKKCSTQTTSAVRPTIMVKVAKDSDPLTTTELMAFKSYMEAVADAGLRVVCISEEPDNLHLQINILYDPIVMDASGVKYVGGKNIVEDTVKSHLASLPFNGVFYPRQLEKALMEQDGIRSAHIVNALAGPSETSMTAIGEVYEPYSGAIQCDASNLEVNYEPIQG